MAERIERVDEEQEKLETGAALGLESRTWINTRQLVLWAFAGNDHTPLAYCVADASVTCPRYGDRQHDTFHFREGRARAQKKPILEAGIALFTSI